MNEMIKDGRFPQQRLIFQFSLPTQLKDYKQTSINSPSSCSSSSSSLRGMMGSKKKNYSKIFDTFDTACNWVCPVHFLMTLCLM